MKRSLQNIVGYTMQAKDDTRGKVVDLLFDEESWVIRYIEVTFEGLDPRKRVLIPHSSLNAPDWQEKRFQLDLTRSEIEESPTIEKHMPFSREYEKALLKHFGVDPYWPYSHIPTSVSAVPYPPRPLKIPDKDIHEEDIDSSLRSFKEIESYQIKGINDTMGQVEDIVVDDEDWQIVYLIVDTSRWLPWSKSVVLSIEWLENISYVNREVRINLETSQIKRAPEFDPSHPIAMDYEKALDTFYQEQKK